MTDIQRGYSCELAPEVDWRNPYLIEQMKRVAETMPKLAAMYYSTPHPTNRAFYERLWEHRDHIGDVNEMGEE